MVTSNATNSPIIHSAVTGTIVAGICDSLQYDLIKIFYLVLKQELH